MSNSIFTPLYFANYFVDQVQNAKNTVVDTFVFDEKLRAPLKSFVEAQRTFTKEANRSVLEFVEQAATATKGLGEKAVKTAKAL